nr:hypothetical protein [Brevibacillus laterosporus]
MRKVWLSGYVIYDEDELLTGEEVAGRIEDLLFNEEFPREWSFSAVKDGGVEWSKED